MEKTAGACAKLRKTRVVLAKMCSCNSDKMHFASFSPRILWYELVRVLFFFSSGHQRLRATTATAPLDQTPTRSISAGSNTVESVSLSDSSWTRPASGLAKPLKPARTLARARARAEMSGRGVQEKLFALQTFAGFIFHSSSVEPPSAGALS